MFYPLPLLRFLSLDDSIVTHYAHNAKIFLFWPLLYFF
nr:MAG TPA: hypothetical protein [Caudoviricetes sp.]